MSTQREFWVTPDTSAPNYFYREDDFYDLEITRSRRGGVIINLNTSLHFDCDIIWEREYTPHPNGSHHEEHDIV